MQIKKVDWINKPESVKIRAHSLTFSTEQKCTVLYTLEEEGTLTLKKHNESVSFLMLHTKDDRIIINRDDIDIAMFGFNSTIKRGSSDEIRILKEKEKIEIFDEENILLTLSNSAFFSSASFGFLIFPSKDEIYLELY